MNVELLAGLIVLLVTNVLIATALISYLSRNDRKTKEVVSNAAFWLAMLYVLLLAAVLAFFWVLR